MMPDSRQLAMASMLPLTAREKPVLARLDDREANLPAVRPQSQGQRQVKLRSEPPPRSDPPEKLRSEPLEDVKAGSRRMLTEDELSLARPDPGYPGECERLRSHCEELLRLNADLRQKQLEQGSFAGKFDHLLREVSQMRSFNQTLRGVAETTQQCRKEVKQLHSLVPPISELSGLMEVAVGELRSSLQEEMREIVASEVASLREQLTRIHENSTRMVGLTLANRKDFDEHRMGLSSNELDELLQLSRSSKELLMSNTSKLDATWDQIIHNKKMIQSNAETINANKRIIEENKSHIQANQQAIKDEQEKARLEALEAVEKVAALQEELSKEHSNAERLALEEELMESQQKKMNMEAHMSELQDELQEGLQEEMDELNKKFDAIFQKLEVISDSVVNTQPTLLQQLHRVSEITRKGNMDINLANGDVKLKRTINFKKKNPGEAPTAEFENAAEANEVLADVAELWHMFKVIITVEGHTKDIGGGSEEFWQNVANSRAALCAAALGVMGVDLGQIIASGKPGKTGLNKAALVIKFDLFPDLD